MHSTKPTTKNIQKQMTASVQDVICNEVRKFTASNQLNCIVHHIVLYCMVLYCNEIVISNCVVKTYPSSHNLANLILDDGICGGHFLRHLCVEVALHLVHASRHNCERQSKIRNKLGLFIYLLINCS